MEDVAAAAGVSKGLVSMVLNGAQGPSEATRRRVLEVAGSLGYRSNRSAALLARRRTRLLGVTLVPSNLYHGELVQEIRSAADAAGYEMVLSATSGRDDEPRSVETLVDFRCEALLLLGPTMPAGELASIVEGVPTVVVGRSLHLPGVDVVRADDVGGITNAVDHLADLGHRRIAHVDGGGGAIADDRRSAYVAAVRGRGLEPVVLAGGLEEQAGADAVEALPPAAGITALVAFNDRTAIGAIDRLERRGMRVPAAVSVTGFDDSLLARHVRIDLTSVGQGHLEQARTAVRLALERLDGRMEAREVVVPTRLVVRGSTATAAPAKKSQKGQKGQPETSP
jgi:LacI family transcriptional regulator